MCSLFLTPYVFRNVAVHSPLTLFKPTIAVFKFWIESSLFVKLGGNIFWSQKRGKLWGNQNGDNRERVLVEPLFFMVVSHGMVIDLILEFYKFSQSVGLSLSLPHVINPSTDNHIHRGRFRAVSLFKDLGQISHSRSHDRLDFKVDRGDESGGTPEVDQCAAGEEYLAASRGGDIMFHAAHEAVEGVFARVGCFFSVEVVADMEVEGLSFALVAALVA